MNRFAPWIQRIVLAAAMFVFGAIGMRYVADPVQAATATGATLNTAFAVTTTRVGFGAFPLGVAIFTVTSLFSTRRLVPAVQLVATLVTSAIVVRVIGIIADGAVPASSKLFIPEGVILLLSLTGLLLQPKRDPGAQS
jgi:predicted membrane-bound mannosyltransferase